MREIKFRAWDKKQNLFWETVNISELVLHLDQFSNDFKQAVKNDSIIWLQHTGLKDKNGKEIYEGDILQFEYYYDDGQSGEYKAFQHTVKWNDEDCGFYPIYRTSNYTMPRERYEVIGNIWENGELLK